MLRFNELFIPGTYKTNHSNVFFFLFLMTKVITVKTRHRLYNKSSILFLRINIVTTLP